MAAPYFHPGQPHVWVWPEGYKDYIEASDSGELKAHSGAGTLQRWKESQPGYNRKKPAVSGLPPEAFSPVASDVILRDKVPADISAQMRAYQVTPDEVVAGGFMPPAAPLDAPLPSPTPTRSIGDAPMAPYGGLPDLPDVADIANGFFHQDQQFGRSASNANVSSRQQLDSSAPYAFPDYSKPKPSSTVGTLGDLPTLPTVLDDFWGNLNANAT